ncbi:MAG: phosphotransferase [Deltaproteobacteria bacterium]|nr:phosphotransferase [Deltaproteobacteria bacterium]
MSETEAQRVVKRINALTAEEEQGLSKRYDIGDWLSWNYEPTGRSNVSLTITTAGGEYILRRSNPRKSLPSILFEVELIDFLRGKGYPAPEIVATRDGKKFVEDQGTFYLLTRCISGRPFEPGNPVHLREAGRALGTYHNLVKHFPGYPPGPASMMSGLSPEGSRSFPAIEEFVGRFFGAEEQQRLSRLFSYVRDRAEDLRSRLQEVYPRLLKLMIHASYGQSALLFDQDTLVGVLDYDRAVYEIRALDLAYSVKELCHRHQEFLDTGKVTLNLDCFRAFLKFYQETEPLPEEEAQVLPLVFAARHVLKIVDKCSGFLAKDAVNPRQETHTRKLVFKLERETAWLEWLAQHEKELRTVVSEE